MATAERPLENQGSGDRPLQSDWRIQRSIDAPARSSGRSGELIQRRIVGAKKGDAVKHDPTGDLFTVDAEPDGKMADGTYSLVSAVDPAKKVNVFGDVRTYSPLEMEWPTDLIQDEPLATLPDPTLVLAGFASLATDLGITMKVNSLTVLEIVQIPAHEPQVGKDVVAFQSMKDEIANLGGAEINLTGAPMPASADKNYGGGFAKLYAVAAQNTGEGETNLTLSLNVNMSKYVDMIHEFAHGFEVGSPPFHLREGLAEVFAAMAAAKVGIPYVYNPSYSTFVAAVHELRHLVGLPALAEYYFEKAGALDAKLDSLGLAEVHRKAIVKDERKLPDNWAGAITALKVAVGGATPATLPGEEAGQIGFTEWLKSEAAAMGIDVGGDSDMGAADKIRAKSEQRTVERRLWLLYRHRLAIAASNAEWAGQMDLFIDGHEVAWKGFTGEEPAATKLRLMALSQPPG